MKQIINAKIVTRERVVEGKTLLFDEKILGILDSPTDGVETVDAEGLYLIPGLIDLHIHGCGGAGASDGSVEAIRTMAELSFGRCESVACQSLTIYEDEGQQYSAQYRELTKDFYLKF